MIYFVQPVGGGPVKIGYSGDVHARCRQLESRYGLPLVVLATMEGGHEEEAEVHARFDHLRLGRTEQFRPGADLMAFIGRPLLAGPNPDAILAMEPGRFGYVIKGTVAYSEWLDAINRKTHIPKAALFRLAMAEWAERNGHPAPPEF